MTKNESKPRSIWKATKVHAEILEVGAVAQADQADRMDPVDLVLVVQVDLDHLTARVLDHQEAPDLAHHLAVPDSVPHQAARGMKAPEVQVVQVVAPEDAVAVVDPVDASNLPAQAAPLARPTSNPSQAIFMTVLSSARSSSTLQTRIGKQNWNSFMAPTSMFPRP